MTEKTRLNAGQLQDAIEQCLNEMLDRNFEFMESDLLGALAAMRVRSEAQVARAWNRDRDAYEARQELGKALTDVLSEKN